MPGGRPRTSNGASWARRAFRSSPATTRRTARRPTESGPFMPTRTPLSKFVADHFAGDLVAVDDGFRVDCPACSAPSSLAVRAWPGIGAATACTSGGCSQDIAAALDIAGTKWDALLQSVVPDSETVGRTWPAILGRSELARLPRPEPLIDNTLDKRTLTFLAGPPGSAKSFVALDWAASIATGTPWLGRASQRGRVLYVAAEGAFGLDARLDAWEQDRDVTIKDDDFHVIGEAVQVAEPSSLKWLRGVVETADYALVVIDTLARSSLGLNESSSSEMGAFVRAVDDLRNAMSSGSIVVLHHASKAGAILRGSSALEGAADTVYVTTKRQYGSILLTRAKRKDGPEEDRHELLLRPIGASVVLVPDIVEPSEGPGHAQSVVNVWTALAYAFSTPDTRFSKSEAWAVVNDSERDWRVSRSTFYSTIGMLEELNVLVRSDVGRTVKYLLDPAEAVAAGLPYERTSLRLARGALREADDQPF